MNSYLVGLSTLVLMSAASATAVAQSFTDIGVGTHHVCAIDDAGEVECSVRGAFQRYDAPDDVPLLVAIAAGDQHTCGIDLDGQAVCWGARGTDENGIENLGNFDELNIPAIDQPLVSIATGVNHTCAIDVDGRVWCWGLNTNGQTDPPGDGYGDDGAGFVKVEGGFNHSCGIETDGDIACWTNDGSLAGFENVQGPFIDLDLGYRTSCGLRDDGSIECWSGNIEAPQNGPYTDLVVSWLAVCGLHEDQTLDCEYRQDFNPTSSVFPEGVTFTSVESGSALGAFGRPFCGITTAGGIVCTSEFDDLLVPGSNELLPIESFTLALAVRRYSRNQIELFWNNPPPLYGDNAVRIEVYRNDVLVDTTSNGYSWYDPSEQSENLVSYRIRAVDALGNVGRFSSTVVVDNDTGEINEENNPFPFGARESEHTVDGLRLNFLGSGLTDTEYVVTWSGSTPGTDGLKGYEVRVDGEVVAFHDRFVQKLESYDASRCHLISVAAVSDDGHIIDYQTIVTNRTNNFSTCRSL